MPKKYVFGVFARGRKLDSVKMKDNCSPGEIFQRLDVLFTARFQERFVSNREQASDCISGPGLLKPHDDNNKTVHTIINLMKKSLLFVEPIRIDYLV
jgi:hypothetical protein